jgi:hypothetical protein
LVFLFFKGIFTSFFMLVVVFWIKECLGNGIKSIMVFGIFIFLIRTLRQQQQIREFNVDKTYESK